MEKVSLILLFALILALAALETVALRVEPATAPLNTARSVFPLR
jgi:hypothetical protein